MSLITSILAGNLCHSKVALHQGQRLERAVRLTAFTIWFSQLCATPTEAAKLTLRFLYITLLILFELIADFLKNPVLLE